MTSLSITLLHQRAAHQTWISPPEDPAPLVSRICLIEIEELELG